MRKKQCTIKELALHQLCTIVFYEDRMIDPGPDNKIQMSHPNAQSVGISYSEILQKVIRAFPDCHTGVASLIWYAVKIRAREEGYENWKLPQRRPHGNSRREMK